MFITLPTIAELQNVQLWSSALLGVAFALWAVSLAVSSGLDWLASRRSVVEEQAERRHFNAVMGSRETR